MKKYFFGIFAFALAISLNSFTMGTKHFGATFYKYNLTGTQTVALREAPSSYIKVALDPNCTLSTNECVVELPADNGNTPDFSAVSFDVDGFPIVDGVTVLKNEKKN